MSTQSPPVVSLRAPKDVSVTDIEHELSQIWKDYQPDNLAQDAIVATQASTFTFIVYEPEPTQHMLAVLGFYNGPIDGIFGPAQVKAIKVAQESYQLPVTGKLDRETMAKIQAAYHDLITATHDTHALAVEKDVDNRGYVVTDAIANTNPRRIITVCPSVGEDTGVGAQVSVYCPMKKQNLHSLVCSEYITLRGTPDALERNGESIANLAVADLPRFLWWKDTPTPTKPLFQQLAHRAHSVIFDSAEFTSGESELLQLHEILNQGMPVIDLNWRRIAGWQELTAEAYDPPARRKDITEIDRVDVNYEQGNPAQAIMFLGWLASRLQWQPTSYTHSGGDYDLREVDFVAPDGRTIHTELAGMPTADSGDIPGDIMGVRLTSSNPKANCNTVLCSEVAGCMQMETKGGTQSARVEEVTSLAERNAEDLLAEYLQRWGRDLLYEESMTVVAQILSKVG
ncbi:glucose-6-phosphate dehydrogenase assembly protein OpcA [Chamaesiphon sp. VAR_48_metabat_403]|uniref:glucose-6-phosphate dehydrogenase assembly protein OpcA n=1 Tax=Chamaesiphon sp. VAR_48_metabat_403 TaxID=2964700 RepID=UPI00286E7BC2|nr:glucose-6-phosphate dehydrogenase assembly protein OpcA [Chamaesiphon sp. VAR_48_metabat_403]